MALLRIISPESPERSVELARHNTLGRHPDNTIQILDRIVSKNHCHIDAAADGSFVLKDLGSLNGTFVNGERVSGECALNAGDEISLGSTKLVFDPPAAAASPGEPMTSTGKQAGRVTIATNAIESHVRAKLT
jgi:adenylate cyclase